MRGILTYIVLILSPIYVLSQNNLTHEVYFETDDFRVVSTEENRLLLFISGLDGVRIEKISIYGFCDDRGSAHYNLNLSQRRAEAIKAVFSNNEIDESLISNVDGKGEILLKIIKEENIDQIRGLNLKVEIIVAKKNRGEGYGQNLLEEIEVLREIIDEMPNDFVLKRFTGETYYDVDRLKKLFKLMKKEGWDGSDIKQMLTEKPNQKLR